MPSRKKPEPPKAKTPPPYEPPRLMKFEQLQKLVVSGE
jgi:hypothetical protein